VADHADDRDRARSFRCPFFDSDLPPQHAVCLIEQTREAAPQQDPKQQEQKKQEEQKKQQETKRQHEAKQQQAQPQRPQPQHRRASQQAVQLQQQRRTAQYGVQQQYIARPSGVTLDWAVSSPGGVRGRVGRLELMTEGFATK
jgi:pyruvate/2-oxoglutarate dehydrogenase complex dihydrolipoamide acyltransferase (E2) component